MPPIHLAAVTKTYPDGTRAVDDVTLDVADGSLTVLVGPSGCGKSTLLRMVAGLETVTDGAVWLGERDVTRLRPADRDIAMVFQNYALYPHMTTAQNIGFSLRLRRRPKAEVRERVEQAARVLELTELLGRKPHELSGGQRQRVAMGRAITRQPQAFLMDEPLSNLDARLRDQMRGEIRAIQRRVGATALYVTHDQVEAMTLGDTVAVMRAGRIEQLGTPSEIYARPANMFVARFVGAPAMSLVRCRLERSADGGLVASIAGQPMPLPARLAAAPAVAALDGGEAAVGIRPEAVEELGGDAPHAPGVLHGQVEAREDLGPSSLLHVRIDVAPLPGDRALAVSEPDPVLDAPVAGAATTTLVAQVAPSSRLRAGDRAVLRLPAEALHLFDTETGASLAASGA